MSKKDYILIASIINAQVQESRGANERVAVLIELSAKMANKLAAEYKGPYAFKRDTFLRACGVSA